jgi:hypothetical protein
MDKIMTHINEHITYPATKDDIVMACDNMSDVTDEERMWVEDKLPDKMFDDPDEVRKALTM